MVSEANAIPDDLEQLRRRFEEFRAARSGRSRFPETLWAGCRDDQALCMAGRRQTRPHARWRHIRRSYCLGQAIRIHRLRRFAGESVENCKKGLRSKPFL